MKKNEGKYKIALVKQEVYQDLYVGNKEMNQLELLLSSMGRVVPFALFSIYNADFYIVKERMEEECQVWRKVIPEREKDYEQLKTRLLNELPGQEFKRPGSDKPNGYYALELDEINWDNYHIVISINCSFPKKIIRKYPSVLWAYMIGEANIFQNEVYDGYDVSLNQLIRAETSADGRIIDFPYTFLEPNCLEKEIFKILKRKSKNKGVYGERNTTLQQPVKCIPQFEIIEKTTGHPILVHQQLIKDNLILLYDAKYYVKVGGRLTRGNGAIEAISAGTLVLMSPDDIVHKQILPKEAWIFSVEEAIEKIIYFDHNHAAYDMLLRKQRELLQQFVIDYPMYYLERAYLSKNSTKI